MIKTVLLASFFLMFTVKINAQTSTIDHTKTKNEVVTTEQIEWSWLNPLRGDKSPAAGKPSL